MSQIKLTLKTQLLGGFITLLILMLISALNGLTRLSGINERLNAIVDVSAEKVKLGARINQDAIAISRAEKNTILAKSQNEMNVYADFIEQTLSDMQDRRSTLRELVDHEGKSLLDQFSAVWGKYIQINRQVRELTRKNSNVKAREISQNEARIAFEIAIANIVAIVEKNDDTTKTAINLSTLQNIAEMMKLGARIHRNLVEIQRGEKNIILSTSQKEMDIYSAEIDTIQKNMERRISVLGKLVGKKGKQELEEFNHNYQVYLGLHSQVRSLSRENSNLRAFDISSEQGRQLHDEALLLIKNIVDKNDKDMSNDRVLSDRNYNESLTLLVFLVIIFLLFGLVLSLFIVNRIVPPILMLKEAAFKVGQGELNTYVKINAKNEMRELADSFNKMVGDIAATAELVVAKTYVDNILASMADTLIVVNPDASIRTVNRATLELLGYEKQELIGKSINDVIKEEQGDYRWTGIEELLEKGRVRGLRKKYLTKDKLSITVHFSGSVMLDKKGEIEGIVCVGSDMTKSEKLEEQLRQSQKMEAIGILAGGIAHDFNNLLTPILGYAEMALMTIDPKSKEVQNLESINESAIRAKELVKQILRLSRKSETQIQAVHLENIVMEVLKFLRASIPTTIDIRLDVGLSLPLVSADPSQIHQVILNLCTNAAHAMPRHGELSIGIHHVKHHLFPSDKDQAARDDWLCLSLQDNGCGIEEAIMERIYEPFFTTKEKGEQRGTGLGLSIVSSIISEHNGHLEVESQVGVGTTFRIYLPVVTMEEPLVAAQPLSSVISGNEHILFVDDDEMVNRLGTEFLAMLGYQVSSFTDSQEALKAFERNPQDFHMLITDYTMPHLIGPELMAKIKVIRPDIPMLLITGYSNLGSPENVQEWGCDGIITKPYDIKELSQEISEALGKRRKSDGQPRKPI
jgi:PAS domain S-box-containing protein